MAQVDFFLKIEGIKGESKDDKHKDDIEVDTWSWGESQTGSHGFGGGGGAGKVAMQDLHVTKKFDKSSSALLLACASGEHIKKVELFCRKAGKEQQEYLKITLSDVLVSSYQTGGNQGSLVPVDQLSFNFAKIEIEYKPQKADGSLDAPAKSGWDVKANKKV
jgi:type VI secretion system secreted protein Hcp